MIVYIFYLKQFRRTFVIASRRRGNLITIIGNLFYEIAAPAARDDKYTTRLFVVADKSAAYLLLPYSGADAEKA